MLGETALQTLLFVFEGVGVVAFALSGALAAVRKRLDVVGVVVIAFLTAMAGGTVRDVLLDRSPLFWVEHEYWLWVIIAIGVGAAIILRSRHFEPTSRAIQWPDALGLGVFAATGTQIALDMGSSPLIATVMGVISAVTGGILRDVMLNDLPWVVASFQLYAILAFGGGLMVWGIGAVGGSPQLAVTVGALSITLARVLSITFNWSLPNWRAHDQTGVIDLPR